MAAPGPGRRCGRCFRAAAGVLFACAALIGFFAGRLHEQLGPVPELHAQAAAVLVARAGEAAASPAREGGGPPGGGGDVFWGESDVVVVPAVYDRWGTKDEHGAWFPLRSQWAYNSSRHKVFQYQRLWEGEPRFVANRGFEGAIYLRFIVDHYDQLPAVMIFLQDDYKWKGFEDCLRTDLTYVNFIQPYKLRNASFFTKPGSAVFEQCVRNYADLFDLAGSFPDKVEPLLGTHPLNNFAVGRVNVRRRPLAVWKEAYERSIADKCHEGPIDMNRVSPEALGKDKYWKKGEVPAERFDKQKQTGGMVLEYMEHMIYGFEPPQIVPFWKGTKEDPVFARDPCDYFVPRSSCAASLC